jgi:hypothetical protein
MERNLSRERLRVSEPVKADFDALQVWMTGKRGRQVTQSEVLEELLRTYRHIMDEDNQ